MPVDRAALRAFFCGGSSGYPDTLYARVEGYRQALLAECRARKIAVHLTGTTNAPTHLPVDSALSDVAAQCSERWPDPTRADGRTWSLPDSLEQIALACRALDDADKAGAAGEPAPAPAPSSSSWRPLPAVTSKLSEGDTSSYQHTAPKWTPAGMRVVMPARGEDGTQTNPDKGASYQRCEVTVAGQGGITGGRRFYRFTWELASGFPSNATDWQVLAQLKGDGTGSPPLSIEVQRGNFVLTWHRLPTSPVGSPVVIGPATPGVHDVIVDVTFSTTASSSPVSAWIDGRQTVNAVKVGATLYAGKPSRLKTGLYRSASIGRAADLTLRGFAAGPTLASVT